jgi:hypothetical protein
VKWWWQSLAGRLAIALLLATLAIAALWWVVAAPAAAAAPRALPPAVAPVTTLGPAKPEQALGFRLAPSPAGVLLASRLQALAPDVAPVVEVFADGAMALRRPPPAATGPTRQQRPAGLLLPGQRLFDLSPAARASAVALLADLRPERPVAAAAVMVVDLLDAPTLPSLLGWVP